MNNIKDAQRCFDRVILRRMADPHAAFGYFETFYSLRALVDPSLLSRDMAGAICRSLKDRGFARYQRGLFTEDGETAGSGYGITRKGLAYLMALEEVS